MVMHLKNCCCGCSLKTGSVIIGVLSGIAALIGLVVAILGASVGTGELQKELVKELHKQQQSMHGGQSEEYDKAINNLEQVGGNKTISVVFICLAIVNAIHLILSILLVFGASAERARMVKPWIVYAVLSLIVQSVLSLVNIISQMIAGAIMPGVLGLVFLSVGVVLGVYFILVVNSFHTELVSTNFQNKI